MILGWREQMSVGYLSKHAVLKMKKKAMQNLFYVEFMFKDQNGCFLIVLDVFGIKPNLMVVIWNLPLKL